MQPRERVRIWDPWYCIPVCHVIGEHLALLLDRAKGQPHGIAIPHAKRLSTSRVDNGHVMADVRALVYTGT